MLSKLALNKLHRAQDLTESPICLVPQNIHSVPKLLDLLELNHTRWKFDVDNENPFSLRVPRSFVKRIRTADPEDPLLRQVLPSVEEQQFSTPSGRDPVNDLSNSPVPGLIHKYAHRALIITTGACPIHCRYCFRRHFPYQDHFLNAPRWHAIIDYIRQNDAIKEIILSGGDPLSLSNAKFQSLLHDLDKITHLKTLRIHSRYPIVQPERIDNGFFLALNTSRLKTVMVVHCNHANELNQEVSTAIEKCRHHNISLFNQAVLLKGVNDDVETLCQLSEKLFSFGILPYYLNLLDPVQGAMHFQVAEGKAKHLFSVMKKRLPGYLVPKLVKDTGNNDSKTWI